MRILMVVRSRNQLGNTRHKPGFWLEERAAPYYVFKDSEADIPIASPKGERRRLNLQVTNPIFAPLTCRFEKDAAAEVQLGKTVRLDSVRQEDFDTVFYPAATVRCGISPMTSTPSS